MNPTVARIQELFAQNEPTNYYWENFEKFLRGHSYKSVARLLSSPVWTPFQAMTLLALRTGQTAVDWFKMPLDRQQRKVLQTTNIQKNTSYDGAPNELNEFKFKVLRSCWDACESSRKFAVWEGWSSGVSRVDDIGRVFMLDAMTSWQTSSPTDAKWKIEALVGTMDSFGEVCRPVRDLVNPDVFRDGLVAYLQAEAFRKSTDLVSLYDKYATMLTTEVKAMYGRWDNPSINVQTWRQLQGYPEFSQEIGAPHPWMQSLCVAYTGGLNRDLPSGLTFHIVHDELKTKKVPRGMVDNPTNPQDYLLAKALKSHFCGEPVTVDSQVAALFGMLEGTPDMVNILLTLNATPLPPMEVDGSVFDYSP